MVYFREHGLLNLGRPKVREREREKERGKEKKGKKKGKKGKKGKKRKKENLSPSPTPALDDDSRFEGCMFYVFYVGSSSSEEYQTCRWTINHLFIHSFVLYKFLLFLNVLKRGLEG